MKFSLLSKIPDPISECGVLYDLSLDRAVRNIVSDKRRADYFISVLEKPLTKTERVAEIIKNKLGAITKSEIVAQCPDIAEITVQRTLAELTEKGDIIKIGGGRYTTYVWNADRK